MSESAAIDSSSRLWQILDNVFDPEIPVLSVVDLGVIRSVKQENDHTEIIITPTYSGCPAMNAIELEIRFALVRAGYRNVSVKTALFPAWTTDWMSEKGKEKLEKYGIAPPVDNPIPGNELFAEKVKVKCPLCHSNNTELISQFGSTACKALYKCLDCKEPFDYFKCHK